MFRDWTSVIDSSQIRMNSKTKDQKMLSQHLRIEDGNWVGSKCLRIQKFWTRFDDLRHTLGDLRHKKLEIHLSLQDAASEVELPFRNSTLNLAATRMVPNFETPDFESLSRYSGESDRLFQRTLLICPRKFSFKTSRLKDESESSQSSSKAVKRAH